MSNFFILKFYEEAFDRILDSERYLVRAQETHNSANYYLVAFASLGRGLTRNQKLSFNKVKFSYGVG